MAKPRKMLNNWQANYIQSIIQIIPTQSKTTLANWVIDYSQEHLIPIWNKHFPDDKRPQLALNEAKKWLLGNSKLPIVKTHILNCHEAARNAENNPVAQACARAIGQSASTIHSSRHCVGLILYGALAIAYDYLGTQAKWNDLEEIAGEECLRMEKALQKLVVDNEPNPSNIDWKC